MSARFELFRAWVERACILDGEEPERSPERIRIRSGGKGEWGTLGTIRIDHRDPVATWAEVERSLDDALPPDVKCGVRLEAIDSKGRLCSPVGIQRTVPARDDYGELDTSSPGNTRDDTVFRLTGLVENLTSTVAHLAAGSFSQVVKAQERVGDLLEVLAVERTQHAQAQVQAAEVKGDQALKRELLQQGGALVRVALANKGKRPQITGPTTEQPEQEPAPQEPTADQAKLQREADQVRAWMLANPGKAEDVVRWAIAQAMEQGLGEGTPTGG